MKTIHANGKTFTVTLRSFWNLFCVASAFMASMSARSQTLGEALNATNLSWTTSGTSGAQGWSVEGATTHDGVSAVQSAVVTGSQTSTLQTTVTGPGTLTFWWYAP